MKNPKPTWRFDFLAFILTATIGGWSLATVANAQGTNVTAPTSEPSSSRALFQNKLKSIIIPNLSVKNLDVSILLQFLSQKSTEQDPDKVGVNFVLLSTPDPLHHTVSLTATNATLIQVLDSISQQTGLAYSIDDNAVSLGAKVNESKAPEQTAVTTSQSSPSNYATVAKLQSIIIPSINLGNASVDDVTQYLSAKSKELDPDKKGINFVSHLSANAGAVTGSPISMTLRNVPMHDVLNYAAEQAKVFYAVDADTVNIFATQNEALMDGQTLTDRTYSIPANLFKTEPLVNGTVDVKEQLGIPFPDGATAFFYPDTSKLVVHNSPSQLDLIGPLIDQLSKAQAQPAGNLPTLSIPNNAK